MKICKTCRHCSYNRPVPVSININYIPNPLPPSEWMCFGPQQYLSLLTGEIIPIKCEDERTGATPSQTGKCGTSGNFWEEFQETTEDLL
jgi:hypothetical protein